MNAFGEEVRRLRKQLKLVQKELALNLNISTTYLSDVERGSRAPFTIEKIQELAEHFQDKKRIETRLITIKYKQQGFIEIPYPDEDMKEAFDAVCWVIDNMEF